MCSAEYRIRRSTPADVDLLERWLMDPTDCRRAIGHAPFRPADFVQWQLADDQIGYVLEGPEGAVGYGEVWVDEVSEDIELAHLVIDPNRRSRGLGKTLTEALYQRATDFGFPFVYMRVYPENHPAIACYQKSGFERIDPLPPELPSDWVWLCRGASQ